MLPGDPPLAYCPRLSRTGYVRLGFFVILSWFFYSKDPIPAVKPPSETAPFVAVFLTRPFPGLFGFRMGRPHLGHSSVAEDCRLDNFLF